MKPEQKPDPANSTTIDDKHSRTRQDHSSGGVAYRIAPGGKGYQIALIATRGWRRWQLPKGSMEANETSEETAVREVEEEVGLRTMPVKFLRSIDYWYWDTYRREIPELVHKTVDFYLLRVVSGYINDSSHEVDGAGWFSMEQALQKLTFQGEIEVVHTALVALNGHSKEAD